MRKIYDWDSETYLGEIPEVALPHPLLFRVQTWPSPCPSYFGFFALDKHAQSMDG